MATSNETKIKDKARYVEKKSAPLFNTNKASTEEKKKESVVQKPAQEDVILFANPVPAEEKPTFARHYWRNLC